MDQDEPNVEDMMDYIKNDVFEGDEEEYNNMVVKNEYTDIDVIAVHNALMGAIRIPEGHGRLIDADDLNNHIVGYVDTRDCPTIIEADKEGKTK